MTEIFDVVGIGFGPSNLAVAICLEELCRDSDAALKSIFLEKQDSFNWHRGMLLDGATLQVSFLKDLVTLRDPTSSFSFVSYLKSKNRLEDFINLNTFYPSRLEYNDYLKWAASRVERQVKYKSLVRKVELVDSGGNFEYFDVFVSDGTSGGSAIYRAKNLVIATGLRPKVLPNCAFGPRVSHSSRFLDFRKQFEGRVNQRFLVVGGGQSAAECANVLYESFKDSSVTVALGTFGFKPADSSSFVNQIFDTSNVDYFYNANDIVKSRLLEQHKDTNYAVVDACLIEGIYRNIYADKVANRERFKMRRLSRLEKLSDCGESVTATLIDKYNGQKEVEQYDGIVLATGYEPARLVELCPLLKGLVRFTEQGEEVLDRNYAVRSDPKLKARLYVQGATENQHGLTSTLLSALATRSGEIVQDILSQQDKCGGNHKLKEFLDIQRVESVR